MKKFSTFAVAALLSACGGGGSDAPQATTSSPSPPSSQVSAPVVSAPAEVVAMPPAPANAVKVTTGSVSQGGNAQVWDISFLNAVNLTVSGQLNQMWIAAAKAGGTTSVGGTSNTIIFRPGTQTAVNVSGSGNTFYLAEGSPIKIEGTGAASSTVKYYKP